jgi:hypothetical protein
LDELLNSPRHLPIGYNCSQYSTSLLLKICQYLSLIDLHYILPHSLSIYNSLLHTWYGTKALLPSMFHLIQLFDTYSWPSHVNTPLMSCPIRKVWNSNIPLLECNFVSDSSTRYSYLGTHQTSSPFDFTFSQFISCSPDLAQILQSSIHDSFITFIFLIYSSLRRDNKLVYYQPIYSLLQRIWGKW